MLELRNEAAGRQKQSYHHPNTECSQGLDTKAMTGQIAGESHSPSHTTWVVR